MDFTKLLDYGMVGIIISAIGFGLWKIIVFTGKRLFDEQTGYFTRTVDAFLGFIDSTKNNLEKQTEILGSMDERLSNMESLEKNNTNILEKIHSNQQNMLNGHFDKNVENKDKV